MSMNEALRALPKAELHCHLDGSLRASTALEIAKEHDLPASQWSLEELEERLVCGRPVHSLPKFLEAFDITCSVLQWKHTLERTAYELAEDAAKENTRYIEVRQAPILCTEMGLREKDVIASISKGLARARDDFGIHWGIIVCALRNLSPEKSIQAAKLAIETQDLGVVGFDLAHAEKGNPAGEHAEAFVLAKKAGLHRTLHAGEDYGPESIRQALDECYTERIGHGITLVEDPNLEDRVRSEEIALECCPSSNVQIQLVPDLLSHPVQGYVDRGLRVTLNTDNRLLTGISLSDEYIRCAEAFLWSFDTLSRISRTAFEVAFLPEKEKRVLLHAFDEVVVELEKGLALTKSD